jgi:hypothetical protein
MRARCGRTYRRLCLACCADASPRTRTSAGSPLPISETSSDGWLTRPHAVTGNRLEAPNCHRHHLDDHLAWPQVRLSSLRHLQPPSAGAWDGPPSARRLRSCASRFFRRRRTRSTSGRRLPPWRCRGMAHGSPTRAALKAAGDRWSSAKLASCCRVRWRALRKHAPRSFHRMGSGLAITVADRDSRRSRWREAHRSRSSPATSTSGARAGASTGRSCTPRLTPRPACCGSAMPAAQ